jgi:hypothetical protein
MPIILAIGRLRSEGLRFEASPDKQFLRPHLQSNQRKMNWECGSSGRALELKPQSQPKKKTNQTNKQKKNMSYFPELKIYGVF